MNVKGTHPRTDFPVSSGLRTVKGLGSTPSVLGINSLHWKKKKSQAQPLTSAQEEKRREAARGIFTSKTKTQSMKRRRNKENDLKVISGKIVCVLTWLSWSWRCRRSHRRRWARRAWKTRCRCRCSRQNSSPSSLWPSSWCRRWALRNHKKKNSKELEAKTVVHVHKRRTPTIYDFLIFFF